MTQLSAPALCGPLLTSAQQYCDDIASFRVSGEQEQALIHDWNYPLVI